MKKHFLLLVMALMSMTSWATIQVKEGKAPKGATSLIYNGAAQSLIATDGEGENTDYPADNVVIYYRISNSSTAPSFNVSTWFKAADVKGTDAGTYKVWYVAYDTDAAAAGAAKSLDVTIGKKALSVVNTPIATPANGVYTGGAQTTAYNNKVSVTDKALGTAIAASNFDISYEYSKDGVVAYKPVSDVQTAGYYKQIVNATSKGLNYTGTLASEVFQIAKVDLMVQVSDESTYYTGKALTGTDFTITYSGWVGGEDKTAITEPTVTNTKVDAGTYPINAADGESDNYNFVYVPGTLTIDPAEVKITPKAMTATLGTEAAAMTTWTGKDYFSTESATAKQAATYVDVQLQNGYDKDGNATYGSALANGDIFSVLDYVEYKDEKEASQKYVKGLTLSRPAGTAAKEYVLSATGASASKNYSIVYESSTFTIGKGTVAINLYNATKAYGDDDPEFTYAITGADAETEAAIKEKISITRAEGEKVGSYTITLTVADNESFTNYTVPATATAKLVVTKRDLEISAIEQVLTVGNTVLNLDQEAVSYETLATGETVAVVLSFDKSKLGTAISAEDVLQKAGTYAKAIVVTPKSGQDALLANYNLTLTPGTLTVIDAAETLYLDDTNKSLDDVIKAANGKNLYIKFSSRELKAGQWSTMVLPFKTSVQEISYLLGYAVVDVLGESTSTDVISLKLAFGDIPANTPFMVQPARTINLTDASVTAKLAVAKKDIVYSANPKAEDGQGHIFKGTYKGATVTSADKSEYYYSPSKKKFVNASGTTTIDPMRAYLKDTNAAGAGARIITIEEADGSVTAIDAVEAQNGENNGAIYNLQGVRVNKAGKGVFIQNGKKYIK